MDRSWIAHGHGGWHADWLVVPRPITNMKLTAKILLNHSCK